MDRLEQKETKKNTPIKSTRYDWLIPETKQKTLDGFKDKIVILFKTNTLENYKKLNKKEIK